MRLNHDCIRDVMLYIEQNITERYSVLSGQKLATDLSDKYDANTIAYTLYQLENAKLIGDLVSADNYNMPLKIRDLTWSGHEYLDNIRDKTAWSKLKESGLASMSLDVAKELAKEIVLSIAKNKLKLD